MTMNQPTPGIDDLQPCNPAPAVDPALEGKPIGKTPWSAPEAGPVRHDTLTTCE